MIMGVDTVLLSAPFQANVEEDCRSQPALLFSRPAVAELENDCKSGGTFFVGRPRTAQATYTQVQDAYVTPLPNGFWLALSPYAPGGPSVLSPSAWERWQAFSQPQP